MNRRTADRIRLLSKELLEEKDEKRILALSAELRFELRKHLKQLRDRLAITEIRERRLKNGVSYDFDEIVSPAAHASPPRAAKEFDPGSNAVDRPSSPAPVPPALTASEPQAQAKEGDPPPGTNRGPEIKAS